MNDQGSTLNIPAAVPDSGKRVRVVHFITELSNGGAQNALLRLLTNLDRARFEATVVCLYNGNEAVGEGIRGIGIEVIDLGMGNQKWRFGAFPRLYGLLRTIRPTILHTWLFHANLPGRVLGRLAGIPIVICSERTMAMEGEWRYRLNRLTIGMVDCTIAVSHNVRDFCVDHIKMPAQKVTVIPNGVIVPNSLSYPLQDDLEKDDLGQEGSDWTNVQKETARVKLGLCQSASVENNYHIAGNSLKRELDSAVEDGYVIGAVSRLYPVKGVNYLVEALVHVDKAELVVIGDGTDENILKQLAEELGVASRIHWLGNRNDVPELLMGFDLFVQPSLHEGMPNTVLEAMAAGLPVVATAVGGTPEVVVDGETGLLVEPANPKALSAGINRLIADPILRNRFGQAGYKRVKESFSVENMVNATTQLYTKLLRQVGS
ncbi:MAG: glycosyltransferase [Chloroflexota bacterium]